MSYRVNPSNDIFDDLNGINDNFDILDQNTVDIADLDNRIENILVGQDLDPNKDVEVLDARYSPVKDVVFTALTDRITGVEGDVVAVDDDLVAHKAENVTDAHGLPYEEGVFTPVLNFGGGVSGIAYSRQEGRYTRVGRVIHFQIEVTLTNKGTSTGIAGISGFPFNCASARPSNSTPLGYLYDIVFPDTSFSYSMNFNLGTSSTLLVASRNNVASVNLNDTNFNNTSRLWVEGSYHI